MKKIMMLSFAAFSLAGYAQTPTTTPAAPAAKDWDVSLYGFVRTDYIWDTRKSAQVRELNLNLYPLDESKLADGSDQNAVGQSNFLSVVSRLGVKVKGPDVWGAKVAGTLEGDFFGNTEPASNTVTNLDGTKTTINQSSSIGMFRLRHAYATLDWSKTQLTFGQTWYPTFIPECFPGVANFSTGILFNPFGWASQVKLKQNFTKEFSFALTAYKDREFAATNPGTQNSASINSALPTLHGQFQYKNQHWLFGLGAEYRSLKPLTVSNGKMSDETLNTSSVVGFLKYSNDKIIVKAYGISGKDMSNLVMVGGFAGYTANTTEPEKYEGLKTTSGWIDIASNGKKVAPGMFFGYTKNGGTGVDGATAFYARGVSSTRSIDNVWRVSGRVDFKSNKFRISPELEYTAATWGDNTTAKNGTADNNQVKISNFRTMVSCVYAF
ncbi:hypothetical protein [Flavobacterium croceum]|uniref:hypothetical protein n=1 Tax=Flavobacterium croceum TaxID=370975 RepID=UPI0024A9797C|nr:hypothetical protein [Flavobacterium croceum]